jgi:hypothetical protein
MLVKDDEELIQETLEEENFIDEEEKQIVQKQKEVRMNDKTGREYKYQADWSQGNRMWHVRCDDLGEFDAACDEMENRIPSNKAFPDDGIGKQIATAPEQATNAPVCGVHGTPMIMKPAGVSKSTGRAYPAFWSCSTRNVDGTYCSYKPAK